MVRALRQRAGRMTRLLEHRQKLVEDAQRELAERQRWVATCQGALDELAASQRALAVSLAALAGKPVDPVVLAGAESYEAWLVRRRDEQEALLEEAKRRAEQARVALIAQRREAKKLEVMRSRWLTAARQLEQKAEEAMLDDVATVRAAYRLQARDGSV
ncbi:flagellar export protein FliJ [Thermomicrobium sp. 4228-Ro]|uniref:flagellar export protein FliJ n=1 Tax=Thermomicrobium sp. 4228-Ro TaxID=2993937 RepID=UPI002248830D|nr:flagellar export protein FliJ [Thermomicrobium sp. 4228-Ro]MCX2727803.1 flagellar export protein FliJ [Thermomicrobium sp. 4228-Ro]